MRCEIVSQDQLEFEGEIDMLVAPGAEGELGILPHHAPLLTTLKMGVLKVRRQGQETVFVVSGGVLDVRPDEVIVLADAAERADEIDVARAAAARRRAEESLRAGLAQNSEAYLAAEAALRRSDLRLRVAAGRRRGHGEGSPSAGGIGI